MGPFASIDFVDAFGRWHPLLLHLPIGLLLALAWLRVMRVQAPSAERSLLWLLGLSSFGAALTGWLLHESGSYPDPVELHEWMGIGVMALSWGLLWVHSKKPQAFNPLLACVVLLLIPTAHFGASLTHGPDFLFDPWTAEPEEQDSGGPPAGSEGPHESAEETEDPVAAPLTDLERFALVQPIVEEHCGRCHGERKRKGGLALHTLEAVLRGGDTGSALDLANPEESELWLRLHLPLEDEEHMPPKKKKQLSAEDIERLGQWVGVDHARANQVAAALPVEAPPTERLPDPFDGALLPALEALRGDGVSVEPRVAGGRELHLDWAGAQAATDSQLAALGQLRDHVVELRMAGQTLSKEWIAEIAKMPRLELLDLSRCQIAPASFQQLAPAPALRHIRLAGTALEDQSATFTLLAMPTLREAVVTGTGLPPSSLAQLLDAESLRVIHGPVPLANVLELEPEVVFEKFEEEEAREPQAPAPSSGLQAINTTCPLTGKPIDPKFRLVFEERVLGFCCANCLADFAADPESYRDRLPARAE